MTRERTSERGIYKEENGTYTVDTTHQKRRLCRRGFMRLSEAKKFKHDQTAIINAGEYQENHFKYEDLEKEFVERHLSKKRDGTADRYMIDINYRIRPTFQFMDLEKITPRMVEDFQFTLIKAGKLSNKSINNCLGTFKTMMTFGVKGGLLLKNPVKVEPLEIPECADDNWWEQKEHIDRFVVGLRDARREPYRAGMMLALECGMRLGEIVGLDKGDINFELGLVTVAKSWNDKDRKPGPTKSGKARILKIKKDGLLYQWLKETAARHPDTEVLFTTRSGERIFARHLGADIFDKWKKRLKLPRITFHGLRHTFASWFMINGGSIWELSKILGHKDFQTTLKKYAHLSKDAAEIPAWDLSVT